MPAKKSSREPEPSVDEQTPDWTVITGLRGSGLADIIEEHNIVNAEIARLEARRRELKELGSTALIKARVKSVLVDGYKVTRVDGTSTKFDKVRFMKLGGKKGMDWYNRSLVRTPYTTMMVTKPKEGGDGEGGEE